MDKISREQVAGCKYCHEEWGTCNPITNRFTMPPGEIQYCPMCGKPLTAEAVDLIMQDWRRYRMRLIDADVISFPYSEDAGTEEQIMDWIEECGLSDEEDKAKMLCWKVIEGFRNVVKTAPTIPAPQWISVEDRLPEEQKEVLIYLPEYDSVEMASLFTIPSMNLREWAQNEDAFMFDEVSYWMPLPEPPKEVMKDGKDD